METIFRQARPPPFLAVRRLATITEAIRWLGPAAPSGFIWTPARQPLPRTSPMEHRCQHALDLIREMHQDTRGTGMMASSFRHLQVGVPVPVQPWQAVV